MNDPVFSALGGKTPEELFSGLPTPCYIIDEGQLIRNCEILKSAADRTGAKILLAQKAFSNYDLYGSIEPYLAGTEASGLYEARLGREEMRGEVHVFCAAYRDCDFGELLGYADHVVFNSVSQLERFGVRAKKAGVSVGLRINPECSTQKGHEIYDPCAPGSRLGVTRAQWDALMNDGLLSLLDGIHFHTLCEQDSDALETTLAAVREKFGDILSLPQIRWLNVGGGHHITRPGYDIERLIGCIVSAQRQWGVEVYIEPGEAVALNAGFLLASVLDVTRNGDTVNVITDASAAAHMPDVLEMPYTPPLYGASDGGTVCRLGGPTCLSGDIIGDYAFEKVPEPGDLLLFGDMAIYTTCKNNTFNGMPLPDIYKRDVNGGFEKLTGFGYDDFKYRLGKKTAQ